MTLAAWDKGVGSCIMGAINKPALTELLGIEEPQKLAFMVAFGYPAHKAHIVPLTAETGVKYYLDENRDYCVPKRSKDVYKRQVVLGSSALVASSQSRTLGSVASARAMAMRCFWPPDSCAG